MLTPEIIGGADGPTSILVASAPRPFFLLLLPALGILLFVLLFLRRSRKKRKK